MKSLSIIIVGIALSISIGVTLVRADLYMQTVSYRQGGEELKGYLAYAKSTAGPRPAVLVVHEWWGLNDYIKRRVNQLAELGSIAFAADIYGNGFATKDMQEAGKFAGRFRGDRQLLPERAIAGLQVLTGQPLADKKRVAAIGYCFGGTTVLELARSGAPVLGIVSFHGGLDTPNAADAKNIKGKVLALHGADDTFVPPAQVSAFRRRWAGQKSIGRWSSMAARFTASRIPIPVQTRPMV